MRSENRSSGAAAANPSPAPVPPRRTFVLLMIVVTALLFAGMLSLLFYRWASLREPSSVIVVEGTPRFKGVEVTVEGVALDAPYTATFSPDREYQLPFYLEPGVYTIRLTLDGKTLLETDFQMGRREGKRLVLSRHEHLVPDPATAPADNK
jgi:hypothetical protein